MPLENALLDVLRTVIMSLPFIYIDVWWFVHLIVGFLIAKTFPRMTFILFLFLIVGYEIAEPFLTFFRPEIFVDTVWDVIGGSIGFFIVRKQLDNNIYFRIKKIFS